MSDQQKTPLSRTLPLMATQRALDEIQKRGAALPGHVVAVTGSIVTVKFDIEVDGPPLHDVTVPVLGAEYIRYPIQVNDLGVAFPASLYIGGVSGLGGGVADMTLRGTLSTLIWFPIGNKNWAPPSDANSLELYGPNGVILKDKGGAVVATLNTSNGFSVTFGSHSLVVNSSGIFLDNVPFAKHQHAASTPGGGTLVAPSGGGPVTGNTGEVSGEGP